MSDTVISVENLSKSYTIQHQSGERYTALRDVLANSAKSVASSLLRVAGSPSQLATRHSSPATEEFWALNDVSFEVKQGERVGIIGRNGAGKSTLLKILSRITEPTKGRVHIKGRVASLLEVGTGFHPELTGRENIYLNGAILGMGREEIRRKFDEIVAFAEVDKFLDTPVKRYSSGMYVRLAFAVAAHLEPEVLVVDEVLAVGDAEFQKKCLGKMEKVAGKDGRTILFVSHNMDAIQSLCTKAINLNAGKVISLGDTSEQIQVYLNSIKYQNSVDAQKPINLGHDLIIEKLTLCPNVIVSGDSLTIDVEFYSGEMKSISQIALLIYSSLGVRVSVLDLRRYCSSHRFKLQRYHQKISIDSLPFVEGNYTIGLYIESREISGNFLDLAPLIVIGNTSPGDVTPYPSQYRGLIDLSFTCSPN